MRQSSQIILNAGVSYLRMAATVAVTLLATPLLLRALGKADFGVLTALVASCQLANIFTSALSAAAARHFAYEIGAGDENRLKACFSTAVVVFLLWSLLVALLGMLLGRCLLQVLTVPPEREAAVAIVFALLLTELCMQIATAPFLAMLQARQSFARLSAIDLLVNYANLGIALFLPVLPIDALVGYAILTLTIISTKAAVAMRLVLTTLTPQLRLVTWSQGRRLVGFTGWWLLQMASNQMRLQFAIVLLNCLFGPLVNAAYAIAMRIILAQSSLAGVLLQVTQPAMTSCHGRRTDDAALGHAALLVSKYVTTVNLFFVVPLLFEAELLLRLWLGDVPPNTALFTRLAVVAVTVLYLAHGYVMAMISRGQIGGVAVLSLSLQSAGLGIAALGCSMFGWPAWAIPTSILLASCLNTVLLPLQVGRILGVRMSSWLRQAVAPVLLVSMGGVLPSLFLHALLPGTVWRLLAVAFTSDLAMLLAFWYLVLPDAHKRLLTQAARGWYTGWRRLLPGKKADFETVQGTS